jgi:hypothetical protein
VIRRRQYTAGFLPHHPGLNETMGDGRDDAVRAATAGSYGCRLSIGEEHRFGRFALIR